MIGDELLKLAYRASVGTPTNSLIVTPVGHDLLTFQPRLIEMLQAMRYIADIKVVQKPHLLQFIVTRYGGTPPEPPPTLSQIFVIHDAFVHSDMLGQRFNGVVIYYQNEPEDWIDDVRMALLPTFLEGVQIVHAQS